MAAGLLGYLAAGAATGYGQAGAQNAQIASQFNLAQMQNEIRMLMEDRIAERSKQDYATQKSDAAVARKEQYAHEEAMLEKRASAERKSDPLKTEREQLVIDEMKRKIGKEKLADEINAARVEVESSEDMSPADKAAALKYLDKQQQGLIGKPKPETEEITTKTKRFTDEGEEETTIKGSRLVTSQRQNSQEQPPIAGARKAPDGRWYIQKDGKWNLVE